jgi:hypothetical protein
VTFGPFHVTPAAGANITALPATYTVSILGRRPTEFGADLAMTELARAGITATAQTDTTFWVKRHAAKRHGCSGDQGRDRKLHLPRSRTRACPLSSLRSRRRSRPRPR